MSTKICNRCSNDLELELFNKKKSGVLCKNCIECNKIISANKRKNIKNKKEDIEQYTDTVIVEDEEGNITIPLRKCSCCFRTIVIWAFTQQGTTYTKQCTECLLKHKKQKKYKLTDTKVQQNTKICNRCCIVKPLVDFKETKKGIQKQCEECCIKYKLLQQQQKAEKLKVSDIDESKEMKCKKCFIIKPISSFSTRKSGKNMTQCIDCNSKQMDYLKKSKCEHGYLNKSACKECGGSSYCEHGNMRTYCKKCGGGSICPHKSRKDRCKECKGSQYCEHDSLRTHCVECKGGSVCSHNVRRTRCRECNFSGYLKYIVSANVKHALKTDKIHKSIEYLGCDIETYKKYLEEQFEEGMTWDNHGPVWHIDHIIPIAYETPTIEEVIKRLHYTNTQPLLAFENMSKGNIYIGKYKLQQEA
jgi:hypothetical protein